MMSGIELSYVLVSVSIVVLLVAVYLFYSIIGAEKF
ncbi:MAG: potassium-transporting ATPase subunit F [Candidatus Thermoplasmatota archaeon]|jgi:hypothetical protein|nr:potassium-transporting ATPase subunit F [Candidatus Thermoplasmatota archaeon]